MVKPDEPLPDFSDVQSGSSSTAPGAQRERTYTVVKGDSLSKIAKREYGNANAWRRIFDANRDVYLKHYGTNALKRAWYRLLFGAWKAAALMRARLRGHRQVRPL